MSMLRLAILFLLGLVGAVAVRAEAPRDRVHAARVALEAGRAGEAAAALRALAEEQGTSANLQLDLGIAEFAAGRVGEAILALERAHWLAPQDGEITAALEAARERAGLGVSLVPAWSRGRDLLSADGWAILGAMALAISCAGASSRLLFRSGVVRVRRGIAAATILATGITLGAALACVSLALEARDGISVASGVSLRVAPFEGAESRGALSEGERVRMGDRHGGFVRVRTGDGRDGWAPRESIASIVSG